MMKINKQLLDQVEQNIVSGLSPVCIRTCLNKQLLAANVFSQ